MVNLNDIPLLVAHPSNYNSNRRILTDIKYIVMHYTSNVNDTPDNNIKYFASTPVKASAHFFVRDGVIRQSVPIINAAYSVGLGSMSKPYIPNPPYFDKCTNSNSISIEMCGSKTSNVASDETKHTACELAAALLKRLNLKPDCVIRHYDVTGKKCPAWAVDDPQEWLYLQLLVNNYYRGIDSMTYEQFEQFMDQYLTKLANQPYTWEGNAMEWAKAEGLMNDGRPKSYITRGELATVLMRVMEKIK